MLGVVGGDAFGQTIQKELFALGIKPILPQNQAEETSIAIVLRDEAGADTSLTLTDARQTLNEAQVGQAMGGISKSDVFYLSGYCLIDPDRKDAALELIRAAKASDCLVILDAVVGMDRHMTYAEFVAMLRRPQTGRLNVDILVSEIPEVARWIGISLPPPGESGYSERVNELLVPRLWKLYHGFCGRIGIRMNWS